MTGNGLRHSNGDGDGDPGAKPLTQVKPYVMTDPVAYAALVARRLYRQAKWRHTTKAAVEHPLNEHEQRRARRAAVVRSAPVVALVFAAALAWGWLRFSWDALRATADASRKQPDRARAALEGTLGLTAALTVGTLMAEGWGLMQGVKAVVLFALLTFPLVVALVMRHEIRWCSDARERKALTRRGGGSDDQPSATPLLVLGETASPPGLARARGTRGDDRA